MLHRTRRSLILVVAIAGLLAGLAAPVSAADPVVRGGGRILPHHGPDRGTALFNVPTGVLGLRSYLGWVYDDQSIAVVGELLNKGETRRAAIDVTVRYFATPTSTSELGHITERVLIDGVARGGVTPFLVYDPGAQPGPGCAEPAVQPCVGAFQVEITSSVTTTSPAAGGLDITVGTPTVAAGVRSYAGTVRNPNSFAVQNVLVALTAYDAAGNVGEVMTPDALVGSIPAGGSAPFKIDIAADFGTNFTMASVAFLADGYKAGVSPSSATYVTSWANYFDDLLGNIFRSSVIWLAEQGITRGCGPSKYCPNDNVTRGQMAAFLDRALRLPATTRDFFTDDETLSFEPAINRLAASRITLGCSPTRFCPSGLVTRGQMAAFLDRGFHLSATTTDFFTDDETSIFEGAINRLAASGITKGCSPTRFCPTANVTRGQMAAFLQRALTD